MRRPVALAQMLGALLVAILAVAIQAGSGLNHDVAWYLQVGRSVADGAPYYVDRAGSYLDVNPPLVIWTLLLPIWIVRRLGWPLSVAPVLLVLVELLWSVALTREVLRRTSRSMALLWGLVVATLVVVGPEFAQREHQAVLLVYPALTALALLPDSSKLPRWLRACVGVSAGVGLALKPHFVLAWILAELAMAACDRRPSQIVRIETVAAAAVVTGYAASVAVFTPGYLPLVREWGPLYFRWLRTPVRILAIQPECVFSVLVLLFAISVRRAPRTGRTALAFSIAGAAFAVAAIVQGKGFSYHWYPAMAFGAVSVASSLRGLELVRAGRGRALVAIATGVVLVLLTSARIADGLRLGTDRRRLEADIASAATSGAHTSAQADTRLVILSTRLVDAFPMVTNLELDWLQRWPSLWVLEAAAPVACAPPVAEGDRIREQRVRDDLLEDLLRARPRTIIVQPLPRAMNRRAGCRTLADHLSHDPRFAALFATYVPSGTIPNGADAPFSVLRRTDLRADDSSQVTHR